MTTARSLAEADASFRTSYPAFAATQRIDALRATEYRRFDEQGHTYLDYTGGSVYAESQLKAHAELLGQGIFGNPHSGNPASLAMTQQVEQARSAVLQFFNASPDEYIVIFTPNATGALKLLGEAYPFSPGGRYLVAADNHNSVNGIREFARQRCATVSYAPVVAPDLRLDPSALMRLLDQHAYGPKLFAYPAQSNFSGVQHQLEWIDEAHDRGWDVLLDAAAYVPTNRLDLRRWRPDFVSLSFYKMFGYPTGTGALLARTSALTRLRRPWFAGGTITLSSVSAAGRQGNGYYLTPGAAGFEDGTVNYLSLPAVRIGLEWLENVGVGSVQARVRALTAWLLEQLPLLRHANGRPVARIYGPRDSRQRGATVALNFLDPEGRQWSCWDVEKLANAEKLSLRAGCHCNPGAREAALEIDEGRLNACFARKETASFDEFVSEIQDVVSGVVRVSLGLASTFADVYRFLDFASGFVDRPSTLAVCSPS